MPQAPWDSRARGSFLRNLELGALFTGGTMPAQLLEHFEHLISTGTLLRWRPMGDN